jgi:hypothetical protein
VININSLSASERETVITYSEENNIATVYTCQRPMMTKMDRLCKSNPDTYKLIKSDEYSKTYSMPKSLISFRSSKVKREYSEEQRKVMADRLRQSRINSAVENNV